MNENILAGDKPGINVGSTERFVSAVAGGWLVCKAFTKPGNRLVNAGAGLYLIYRAFSGNCNVYDYLGKRRLPNPVKNINVRNSTIVNRPKAEVYAFWRTLQNLPLFMKHLKSVEETTDGKWHWTAEFPGVPGTISWDASIVKEEENSFLGWNSLPGSAIDAAGKVAFIDAGGGRTEINTVITYRAPFGPAGEAVGRLLNPALEKIIQTDLQEFGTYFELAMKQQTYD